MTHTVSQSGDRLRIYVTLMLSDGEGLDDSPSSGTSGSEHDPKTTDRSWYRRWLGDDALVAHLQGEGLSLVEAIDNLIAANYDAASLPTLELVGITQHPGPVALSWLRRVAAHIVRSHPDLSIVVANSPLRPPGTGSGRHSDGAHDPAETLSFREVTGHEAPLHNPSWEELPEFTHHLLLCRGPRCNAQGASDTVTAVNEWLHAHHATDSEVLVTQTGCMFPCNWAPVAALYPEGSWHHLPAEDVEGFLGGVVPTGDNFSHTNKANDLIDHADQAEQAE